MRPDGDSLEQGGGQKMDIDEAESDLHEPLAFDQPQDFVLAGDIDPRKCLEISKRLRAPGNVPAGEFPDDERMAGDVTVFQEGDQPRVSETEMIDPNGGVDEDHRSSAASAPGDRTKILRRPPELGQPLGAFPGDEIFEAGSDQGRLLPDAGQFRSPGEKGVVDVDRRSHMYMYAIFMHICQAYRGGAPSG